MPTLYIAEYAKMMEGSNHPQMVDEASFLVNNNISLSGSSAQSNALNVNTRAVRLHADAICSFRSGLNPTATTADKRMVAGATEYMGIPEDIGTWKFAAITNT